jgi:hypothetical protein
LPYPSDERHIAESTALSVNPSPGYIRVERIPFLPMARGSDSGHDSEESDLETEWLFPSDVRTDSPRATNSTTADSPADASDWIAAFEKAAFGVDNSPAFGRTPVNEPTPSRELPPPVKRPSERCRRPGDLASGFSSSRRLWFCSR